MPFGCFRDLSCFRGATNQVVTNTARQSRPGVNVGQRSQAANQAGGRAQANAGRFAARRRAAAPSALDSRGATSRQNGNAANISLFDLRRPNEEDHNLVTIPSNKTVRQLIRQVRPNSHPSTDQLQGRAYLQALVNDNTLGVRFRGWLDRRVLNNSDFQGARLDHAVAQLRLIASAARSDDGVRRDIENLASEGSTFCVDRSGYFFNAMWGQAFLYSLGNGREVDPVDLYNIGIGFYRLELVREAVRQVMDMDHRESVQSMLETEYKLQEVLDLPTSHQHVTHVGSGQATDQNIERVRARVVNKLIADEGRPAIQFMMTWGPWKTCVAALNEYRADYEELTSIFHNNLERLAADRETPNSDANLLPENMYVEEQRELMRDLQRWTVEVVGQHTWSFLFNARADAQISANQMSSFFRQNG